MIFDGSNPLDAERARTQLEYFIANGKKFEQKEKRKKRTLSQNALFHVWIKVFAEHTGELNLDDCKMDVKRCLLGMKERVNKLTGEVEACDYETSKMDTKELSDFMGKFKVWAQSEWGCYLPYKDDAGYDEMISMYYR